MSALAGGSGNVCSRLQSTLRIYVVILAVIAAACGPKPVDESAQQGLRQAQAGPEGDAAVGIDPVDDLQGAEVEGAEGSSPDAAGAPVAPDGTANAGSRPGESSAAGSSGTAVGVSDKEIVLGIHYPGTLSGVNLDEVFKYRKAMEAYFNGLNSRGGINGRKVVVHYEDDKYSADTAIQACRNLQTKKIFMTVGVGGVDQAVACGDFVLDRGQYYISGGVSEAGLIGRLGYWAITMTYDRQGALMGQFVLNRLAGASKNIGLIRINSANVKGAHDRFAETVKAGGAKIVVDDVVDKNPNPSQATSECIKLAQNDAKIVLVLASGLVGGQLADECERQGYRPQWLGIANTLNCRVTPPFGGRGYHGSLCFSTNHLPEDTESDLEKQAYADWNKLYPDEELPSDQVSLWGFFDVIRKGLESAGRSLTHDTFQKAMNSLSYDNGLLHPVRFGPGDQIGGDAVVIVKGDVDKGRTVQVDATWRSSF